MKKKIIVTLVVAMLVSLIGCSTKTDSALVVEQNGEVESGSAVTEDGVVVPDLGTVEGTENSNNDDFIEADVTVYDENDATVKVIGVKFDEDYVYARVEVVNNSDKTVEVKYCTACLNGIAQTDSLSNVNAAPGVSSVADVKIARASLDFVEAYGIGSIDDVVTVDVSFLVSIPGASKKTDVYNIYKVEGKTFERTVGEVLYEDDNVVIYYGGTRRNSGATLMFFAAGKGTAASIGAKGFASVDGTECRADTFFEVEAEYTGLGTIKFVDKETGKAIGPNDFIEAEIPMYVGIYADREHYEGYSEYDITVKVESKYVNK